MTDIGVAARTAVGVVLLAAGVAKLASRSWVPGVRAFGLPALLVPVLPWFEVGLGALVVADVGGRPIGAVALVLLLVFTAGLGRMVAAGDAPPCGCFGEASSRPATWGTVLRNLFLCALATLALFAGSPEPATLAAGVLLGASVVASELRPAGSGNAGS